MSLCNHRNSALPGKSPKDVHFWMQPPPFKMLGFLFKAALPVAAANLPPPPPQSIIPAYAPGSRTAAGFPIPSPPPLRVRSSAVRPLPGSLRTSNSSQLTPRLMPVPSAFAPASLAANRAARLSAEFFFLRWQYSISPGRKYAPQKRLAIPLHAVCDPLNLDQVRAKSDDQGPLHALVLWLSVYAHFPSPTSHTPPPRITPLP